MNIVHKNNKIINPKASV